MQDELQLHYSVIIAVRWQSGKQRQKENIALNTLQTFTWKKIEHLDYHGSAALTFSSSPQGYFDSFFFYSTLISKSPLTPELQREENMWRKIL